MARERMQSAAAAYSKSAAGQRTHLRRVSETDCYGSVCCCCSLESEARTRATRWKEAAAGLFPAILLQPLATLLSLALGRGGVPLATNCLLLLLLLRELASKVSAGERYCCGMCCCCHRVCEKCEKSAERGAQGDCRCGDGCRGGCESGCFRFCLEKRLRKVATCRCRSAGLLKKKKKRVLYSMDTTTRARARKAASSQKHANWRVTLQCRSESAAGEAAAAPWLAS